MSTLTESVSEATTADELQAMAIDARLKASAAMDKFAAEVQPNAIIERTIDELTDQAATKINEARADVSDKLLQNVRRNAWPVILAGAGVLYLLSRYEKKQ